MHLTVVGRTLDYWTRGNRFESGHTHFFPLGPVWKVSAAYLTNTGILQPLPPPLPQCLITSKIHPVVGKIQ